MKNLFRIPFYLSIFFFCFFSCQKELIVAPSSNITEFSVDSRASGATKKAITITTTDHDTGDTTTEYDCTKPGESCKVKNTIEGNDQYSFIEDFSNSEDFTSGRFLKDDEAKGLFPMFTSSESLMNLERGDYSILWQNEFLVLKRTADGTAIAIYEIGSLDDSNNTVTYEKAAEPTRKAQYNVEAGWLDCTKSGKNCTVAKEADVNNPSESSESLVSLVDNSFPGLDLVEAASRGEYSIIKIRNGLAFNPVSGGESYYVLIN